MYGWGLSLKYFNLGFKFKSFPALGKFAVTCRCIQSCDIIHLQTLQANHARLQIRDVVIRDTLPGEGKAGLLKESLL